MIKYVLIGLGVILVVCAILAVLDVEMYHGLTRYVMRMHVRPVIRTTGQGFGFAVSELWNTFGATIIVAGILFFLWQKVFK